MPAHSPEWVYDRNRLWNEVEKAEKRKYAQLCREINVAAEGIISGSTDEDAGAGGQKKIRNRWVYVGIFRKYWYSMKLSNFGGDWVYLQNINVRKD